MVDINIPPALLHHLQSNLFSVPSPHAHTSIWQCASHLFYNNVNQASFLFHTATKLLSQCIHSFLNGHHCPSATTTKEYKRLGITESSAGPAEIQALSVCLGIHIETYAYDPQSDPVIQHDTYQLLPGVPPLANTVRVNTMYIAQHDGKFWLICPTRTPNLYKASLTKNFEGLLSKRLGDYVSFAIESRHLRPPSNNAYKSSSPRPPISLIRNLGVPSLLSLLAMETRQEQVRISASEWEGPVPSKDTGSTLRCLSLNVNGLLTMPTNLGKDLPSASAPLYHLSTLLGHAKAWDVDIIALQDTRVSISEAHQLNLSLTSVWQRDLSAAGAARFINAPAPTKRGGVSILVSPTLGPRVSRVLTDPRGWGRFLAIEIKGRHQRSCWFISAYFPTLHSSSDGSISVFQRRQLNAEVLPNSNSTSDPILTLFKDLDVLLIKINPNKDRVITLCGDFNIDPSRNIHSETHLKRLSKFLGRWNLYEPYQHPNPSTALPTYFRSSIHVEGVSRPDHIYVPGNLQKKEKPRLAFTISLYRGSTLANSDHKPIIVNISPGMDFLRLRKAIDYFPSRERKVRLCTRVFPPILKSRKASTRKDLPEHVKRFHQYLDEDVPADLLHTIPDSLIDVQEQLSTNPSSQEKAVDYWRRISALLILAGHKAMRKKLPYPSLDTIDVMPLRPPSKPFGKPAHSRRSFGIWGKTMAKGRTSLRLLCRLQSRLSLNAPDSLSPRLYLQQLLNNPFCRDRLPKSISKLGHSKPPSPTIFNRQLITQTTLEIATYTRQRHAKFRLRIQKELASRWAQVHKDKEEGRSGPLFGAFKSSLSPNQDIYSLEVQNSHTNDFELISNPQQMVDIQTQHYQRHFAGPEDDLDDYENYPLWQDTDEALAIRQAIGKRGLGTLSTHSLEILAPPRLHSHLLEFLSILQLHPKLRDNRPLLDQLHAFMETPITWDEWSSYWSAKSAQVTTGYSALTYDLIKEAPEPFLQSMLKMANLAVSSTYMPLPLRERVIKAIPKAGKGLTIKDLRPIQLIHPITKAIKSILIRRFVSFLLRENILNHLQFAFIKGGSTQTSQLLHTALVEQAHSQHSNLFIVRFDLKKAFDSVHRLFGREVSLRRLGLPERIIQFFLNCDRGNRTYIFNKYVDMYDPNYSGVFEALFGFPQGDEDSPLGYVIFKDMLLTYLHSRTDLDPPSINGFSASINSFADDLRAYSKSLGGAQRIVVAIERFLLLFRGRLAPQKSSHSSILWQLDDATNTYVLRNGDHSLYTSDGSIIPYEPTSAPVKDLGFKTSLDLANKDQVNDLAQRAACHASRLSELLHMNIDCAWLIDLLLQTPSIAYACSFLPITQKDLAALDFVGEQALRGKFRLSSKFPSALLHAYPLGVGRLGLYYRVLLDRWAIFASLLSCVTGTFHHSIAINLLDQFRTAIHQPASAVCSTFTSLLPSTADIDSADPQLNLRWLYPLCAWLPKFNLCLIQGPMEVAADDLYMLLGLPLNSPTLERSHTQMQQHSSSSYSILCYSDGSHIHESDVCAFAYRIVILPEAPDIRHKNGIVILSGSQAIRLTPETANSYIAELLGLLAALHALALLTPSVQQPPQLVQHRLDNSAVVSTATDYHCKTPYEWLRTAAIPLWRCFHQLIHTIPTSSQPSVLWMRGHPEKVEKNPDAWDIHQVHNNAVDETANHAATGPTARRLPASPFNILKICPGPTWCSTSVPPTLPFPLLGPLRPTLRSRLATTSLHTYLRERVANTNRRYGALAIPHAFSLSPTQLHLPSINSTWKQLGAHLRGRFTKIWSGWIATASRQHQWSNGSRPASCPLCLRHNAPDEEIPMESLHHFLHDCRHLNAERSNGYQLLIKALLKVFPKLTQPQAIQLVKAYWDNIPNETRAGIPTIALHQWLDHPTTEIFGDSSFTSRILSVLFHSYLCFTWKLWKHRNSLIHVPVNQLYS